MKKALIIGAAVAVAIIAIVLVFGGDDKDDSYRVRAIFDSGGFMVKGEEVRVAGANVGEIESVGVTMPGEVNSYEDGKWQAIPGKAVIVMKINDPGFEDFRSDATCLIRPQSLIGEKFVDCRPTVPRAPGSKPAPPLKQIPDGEPGAGEYLLPVENNSTSVDPDLINNIQSLPYAQRFRLIFNELGAGLAGRGEDIEEVVKRANPVLRDADRLFGILSEQSEQLAQLTADSDEILRPFSRERAAVAGFFSNSGAAAEASAERGEELEESFAKLPAWLREFRLTMRSLEGFSDAAAPVFSDFDEATPAFTEATRALAPFSAASTRALKSLGDMGEAAGPKLRAADPIITKSTELSNTGAGPTTKLAKFLVSTKDEDGWDGLADLIYNSAGASNGFDQYGHSLRSLVTLTICTNYVTEPQSGCNASFNGPGASTSSAPFDSQAFLEQIQEELAEKSGGTSPGKLPPTAGLEQAAPSVPAQPSGPVPGIEGAEQLGASAVPSPSQRALLDYLLGP